jgi:TolB-like protein/class 3 adenylate cyclase
MQPRGNERVARRLAAILAADVAGYSRLIGADEEGTLAALRAIRRELGDPKIAEHRGRIVKTTGDGLLVEFVSVVDALRCAAEVQAAMAERNAGVAPDKRIEFRIGIHQGDIVVEDGDIFGDGVNIAARLEGLAEPGGICVSARVQEDAAGRLDLGFEDLGEPALKNIARPIRVYRVRPLTRLAAVPLGTLSRIAGEEGPLAQRAVGEGLPLPDKPSIAVLPFQNMSGDPEQEYFVDGMVEEITTALSRIRWLFVIARNSSFTYKGRAVDVKQVARELGVRYVLEGSVRKSGNRVRITGQLIDTATGAHIWAERYDRELDDIFALQDEVASNVAGAIEPRLRDAETERLTRKPTASLDAYDLYLRAVAKYCEFNDEALNEAVALVYRAIEIDPDYAAAASAIGVCRVTQRSQGWGPVSDADIADAVRLSRRVFQQRWDDPEALIWAANTVRTLTGEITAAAAAIDRALTLNPNSAWAWSINGWNLISSSMPDRAAEAFQRAMRLSPLDPLGFVFTGGLALAHFAMAKFDQAIIWADRSLDQQLNNAQALRTKLAATAVLGHREDVKKTLERLLVLQPSMTIARLMASIASVLTPEVRETFGRELRRAGLPEE